MLLTHAETQNLASLHKKTIMLRVYSSSAGSGKTYTLTREYLRLALDPRHDQHEFRAGGYFRHILAITFTNAAANEMKDRILSVLGQLANHQPTPYTAELVEAIYGLTPAQAGYDVAELELRKRADTTFHNVLHNYSDFSVTTIDSFMQRLVMAFTDELGLPYSFEVELDTEAVLERAIDNLIERAGTDAMDDVTAILQESYAELAEEGKNWNQLPDTLREFGKHLTSDQVYEQVKQVLSLQPADLRQIQQQMWATGHDLRRRLADIATEGCTIFQDAGVAVTDFSYGDVGRYFTERADASHTPKPPGDRMMKDAIGNDTWYAKKAKPSVQVAIDGIKDQLRDCINRYETLREAEMPLVHLFDCLLPNLRKLALLRQIRVEFDDLLRKDGRVHISEFNQKILGIVATEPVPFLFERLGTRYFHLLIDEFQDTSRLQFANLLPLLENALAFEHDNLAVGDGKQAIYGFRGGDMDQIVALHAQNLPALIDAHGPESWTADRIEGMAGKIESQFLDTNWRSAQPIVAFNNQFFEFVAEKFSPAHAKVRDVYDLAGRFQQKPSPKARIEGHVQLDFVQPAEHQDATGAMVSHTLTLIEQVRAEGYDFGDIAVLCRRKKDAQAVATELNRLGYPLVSADSLSLGLSEPVRLLTALLELLNRPDQKRLRYDALFLFYRVVEGHSPDFALTEQLHIVAEDPNIGAMYAHLDERGYRLDPDALSQLPVYELVEWLMHCFKLVESVANQPFLFRFADEVLTFGQRQGGHLADWLLHWATVKDKVSVQGSAANAISIQTVHKAKGLEFPVVIIPFANWSVEPLPQSEIWLDLASLSHNTLTVSNPTGKDVRLTTGPVRLSSALTQTPDPTAGQYQDEMTRTFLETMNLLYVAFTRPTDRLYVLAEPKEFDKPGQQKSVAYWLQAFLDGEVAREAGCGWQTDQWSYTWADCRMAFSKQKPAPANQTDIRMGRIVQGTRGQNLQLRRQADRLFDVTTFARTRDRDRRLVAALSLVRGLDDIPNALRQLVADGLARASDCADLERDLQAIATHPDLADVFDPTLRIDTDRSILHRNQLNAAPHRVAHRPDGSLVLLQYESADAMAEGNVKTLRYFVSLYGQMGFWAVEARVVYLTDPVTVMAV